VEPDVSHWIGATERTEDLIAPAPVRAAAALLDDASMQVEEGTAVPPLWHWFYFLATAPQSQIAADGHPRRGGFMPPIELPRRMFAGARLRFHAPLRVGRAARRDAVIRAVSHKHGASGELAFVTVGYTITQDGLVCLEEEQDIVYREAGGVIAAPTAVVWDPPVAGSWSRVVTPDPTLLMRFSAVTFNAHRIHYDRDYATTQEGYPGLVVHGPLTAVLLLELVRRNVPRVVTSFDFRGRAPLFDLAPFRVTAAPDGERGVRFEAQGPDGRVAMTATAELGPAVDATPRPPG